jgi:hypothetical protein
MNVLATFSMDSKLASNSAFFDTHVACLKFFYIIFPIFERKRIRNGSIKQKNIPYQSVLELNLAAIDGLGEQSRSVP